MLISSVILILQETLEAVMVISILLAISYGQRRKITWLAWGLGVGTLLAYLYASHMSEISEWFDYVGQEVVNAFLQISISLVIIAYAWTLFKGPLANAQNQRAETHWGSGVGAFLAAGIVALAIAREGAEAVLYLGGYVQQSNFQSVMTGSFIGFSIGISVGILLLYGLLGLPDRWHLCAPVILLALIAGNMLSQATLQLTQADWISSTRPLWDTSAWLAENSVTGQLLYALIGYEATPSIIQIVSYIAGAALVMVFAALGKHNRPPIQDGFGQPVSDD